MRCGTDTNLRFASDLRSDIPTTLDCSWSPTEAANAAGSVLREIFGFPGFRGGQEQAVTSVLTGRDAVVLLPTGAGKSLCYQVPAIVFSKAGRGTTLVISPLIALMHDQVTALRGRGVKAAALNSHQEDEERQSVVASFLRGELDLLYVSPERAAKDSFKRMLGRVKIALLAIDEAHCLSQWGHDFRPEYMRLNELREIVNVPTIASTATATPRVMDEIVNHLDLTSPVLIRGNFARPNLQFSVHHLRTDASRLNALVGTLDEAGFRSNMGAGRAIVYCSTRKKTESVATTLKGLGFSVGYYHAGRTKLARERIQRAFSVGRVRTLVATNAFGMGIDYPDVRVIVHFQAPGTLEAYYQEAGRAGRDGLLAQCAMFFGASDMMTQRRLKSGNKSAAMDQHNNESLAAVEAYAKRIICRQEMLCSHFTGRPGQLVCEVCDVCVDPNAVENPVEVSQANAVVLVKASAETKAIILEAVDHLERPVGKTNLARALKGSRAKAMKKCGLLDLPEHGRLKHVREPTLVAAIEEMIREGILVRRGNKYPTVWLPKKAVPSYRRSTHETQDRPQTLKRSSGRPRNTPIARELENYRKRMARTLRWKPYMVFQRRVLTAIDKNRPSTRADLERIPGLGPAKIERFGDDILALVRRHE